MVQSPNYTGEKAGIGMIRGGGEKVTESLQELNRTILEADKFKYTERKREEASFLESIKTKPEFVISAQAREAQAKALTQFNQKYSPLIKKGYLTIEEKTAMANDRAALEAMQQEQLAQYQQYLTMKEAMQKDTRGQFDRDEFRQWEEDYQQSGQFDHATMPLMGVSPYLYLRNNPVKGTETYDPKTSSKISGTDTEAQAWIREQAYTYEPFRIGLIKEFKALSPQDKAKYLDVDKSGTVSPQEAQAGEGINIGQTKNPILEYAYEKYTKTAIGIEALKPTAPRTKTTSNLPNLEAFGKTTKYAPTEAVSTRLGQTDYKVYHPFNNIPVSDIPMGTPIRILNPAKEEIKKPDTTVSVDVTGYDEEKDEFTFIVKSNFEGLYGYTPMLERGKDWRIAVKRTDLPTEYNSLEILKNGKRIKVGDLRPKEGVNTTTPVSTAPKRKLY